MRYLYILLFFLMACGSDDAEIEPIEEPDPLESKCRLIEFNGYDIYYDSLNRLQKLELITVNGLVKLYHIYSEDTIFINGMGLTIVNASKNKPKSIYVRNENSRYSYFFDYSVPNEILVQNNANIPEHRLLLDVNGNVAGYDKGIYRYDTANNPLKDQYLPTFDFRGIDDDEYRVAFSEFFSENNVSTVQRGGVIYQYQYEYDTMGNVILQVLPNGTRRNFKWDCDF